MEKAKKKSSKPCLSRAGANYFSTKRSKVEECVVFAISVDSDQLNNKVVCDDVNNDHGVTVSLLVNRTMKLYVMVSIQVMVLRIL